MQCCHRAVHPLLSYDSILSTIRNAVQIFENDNFTLKLITVKPNRILFVFKCFRSSPFMAVADSGACSYWGIRLLRSSLLSLSLVVFLSLLGSLFRSPPLPSLVLSFFLLLLSLPWSPSPSVLLSPGQSPLRSLCR